MNSENIIQIKINEYSENLKSVLEKEMNISGRLFKRLIKSKSIKINGKKSEKGQVLNIGDIVEITLEDETDYLIPEDIKLDIIYEDADILAINKPKNIVIHPTKNIENGTIANAVRMYFDKKNIKRKVRFVNRLDMDTTGVLIVAKNSFAHQNIAKQMEEGNTQKCYVTVLEGELKEDVGAINTAILREGIKSEISEGGKKSSTNYEVIKKVDGKTFVKVIINTGRTHQIRVHFSSLGNPILGDTLYGEKSKEIDRQALHSLSFEFTSPRENKRIKIEADIPVDIKKIVKEI